MYIFIGHTCPMKSYCTCLHNKINTKSILGAHCEPDTEQSTGDIQAKAHWHLFSSLLGETLTYGDHNKIVGQCILYVI
jgi:hypothetical protein